MAPNRHRTASATRRDSARASRWRVCDLSSSDAARVSVEPARPTPAGPGASGPCTWRSVRWRTQPTHAYKFISGPAFSPSIEGRQWHCICLGKQTLMFCQLCTRSGQAHPLTAGGRRLWRSAACRQNRRAGAMTEVLLWCAWWRSESLGVLTASGVRFEARLLSPGHTFSGPASSTLG